MNTVRRDCIFEWAVYRVMLSTSVCMVIMSMLFLMSTTGPWYVAEVLTGMYGVIGVHGVYVGGHFLPGSMTYLHEQFQVSHSDWDQSCDIHVIPPLIQLLFFHIPFIFYLNSIIKSRTHDRHVTSFGRKACQCCCHVTMALLMLLQLSWAISIYPYGIWALLLCPGVLWPACASQSCTGVEGSQVWVWLWR